MSSGGWYEHETWWRGISCGSAAKLEQVSVYKGSLKFIFKHACKTKFVWYNNEEDGRECTDSVPPSQYKSLSPERLLQSFISFYFYTLTEKGRPEGRPFLVRRITNVIKGIRRTLAVRSFLSIRKELSVMSTFETLYLMIAFATLIVMMLK